MSTLELTQKLKLKLPLSYWGKVDKLVELDREWAERISKVNIDNWRAIKGKGINYVMFGDIEHDIKGILEEDEHFIPRL